MIQFSFFMMICSLLLFVFAAVVQTAGEQYLRLETETFFLGQYILNPWSFCYGFFINLTNSAKRQMVIGTNDIS